MAPRFDYRKPERMGEIRLRDLQTVGGTSVAFVWAGGREGHNRVLVWLKHAPLSAGTASLWIGEANPYDSDSRPAFGQQPGHPAQSLVDALFLDTDKWASWAFPLSVSPGAHVGLALHAAVFAGMYTDDLMASVWWTSWREAE